MEFTTNDEYIYMSGRGIFRGVRSDQICYPRSVRLMCEHLHFLNHSMQMQIEETYRNIRDGEYDEKRTVAQLAMVDVLKMRLHKGKEKINKCNKMLGDRIYSFDEDDDLNWIYYDLDWLSYDKYRTDPEDFSIALSDVMGELVVIDYSTVVKAMEKRANFLAGLEVIDNDLPNLIRYKRIRRQLDKLQDYIEEVESGKEDCNNAYGFWRKVEAQDEAEYYWGIYRSQNQFYKEPSNMDPDYEKDFESIIDGNMDKVFEDAKSYEGEPEYLFSNYLMTKYKSYLETGNYEHISTDKIEEVEDAD